ncbi:hypothetical protein SVAN01_10385 [Stagonosporopsis vannaccii]|nr:hypothetical protein SVAN01_10385 [Stagonosporopsis vannaccii]
MVLVAHGDLRPWLRAAHCSCTSHRTRSRHKALGDASRGLVFQTHSQSATHSQSPTRTTDTSLRERGKPVQSRKAKSSREAKDDAEATARPELAFKQAPPEQSKPRAPSSQRQAAARRTADGSVVTVGRTGWVRIAVQRRDRGGRPLATPPFAAQLRGKISRPPRHITRTGGAMATCTIWAGHWMSWLCSAGCEYMDVPAWCWPACPGRSRTADGRRRDDGREGWESSAHLREMRISAWSQARDATNVGVEPRARELVGAFVDG